MVTTRIKSSRANRVVDIDPDAVFSLLKHQIEDGCWHEAAETAESLLDWILSKNKSPRLTGCKRFDRIVVESTCRIAATWRLLPEGHAPA